MYEISKLHTLSHIKFTDFLTVFDAKINVKVVFNVKVL